MKSKKNLLTLKQNQFCFEYVKLGNMSEAYRRAYSTDKMSPATVNRSAHELYNTPKITARINELREEVEKQELYTLEESVRRDLRLLDRYERALTVLEDKTSSEEEIETARRTIRFIGSNGFGQAQERLNKIHGYYDSDNRQKKEKGQVVIYLPDNGR